MSGEAVLNVEVTNDDDFFDENDDIVITTTVKDDWWKRLVEVTNLIFSPFLKFQFSHQDHLFTSDFLFHPHQHLVKIKPHKIWIVALESTIVVSVNAAHVSQTKELLCICSFSSPVYFCF